MLNMDTRLKNPDSDNVEATTWKRQRGSDNVEMTGGGRIL